MQLKRFCLNKNVFYTFKNGKIHILKKDNGKFYTIIRA